jgi:hypothetical protein
MIPILRFCKRNIVYLGKGDLGVLSGVMRWLLAASTMGNNDCAAVGKSISSQRLPSLCSVHISEGGATFVTSFTHLHASFHIHQPLNLVVCVGINFLFTLSGAWCGGVDG